MARAHKLFIDPVSKGKRFVGRLGNLDTRVSTINEAMAIERSGLIPRFEFKVGNRYADIVGLDRARHPARVLQLVKQVRPGIYSPRELPAASAIQRSLGIDVEFIVTGTVR